MCRKDRSPDNYHDPERVADPVQKGPLPCPTPVGKQMAVRADLRRQRALLQKRMSGNATYRQHRLLRFFAVTRIEQFLFSKLNGAAPFPRSLAYQEQKLEIEIVSFPDRTHSIKADFRSAVIESMEFDQNESIE